MKNFFTNYRAYSAFLLADGFSPVVNELGNFAIAFAVLLLSKWLGLLIVGVPLALGILVFQKFEAYKIGERYLKTHSVELTKQFIKFKYGLR